MKSPESIFLEGVAKSSAETMDAELVDIFNKGVLTEDARLSELRNNSDRCECGSNNIIVSFDNAISPDDHRFMPGATFWCNDCCKVLESSEDFR